MRQVPVAVSATCVRVHLQFLAYQHSNEVPQHPRASSTDDVECFFVLHNHLGLLKLQSKSNSESMEGNM